MASKLACIDILHVAHHAAGEPALWEEVAARLSEQLQAPALAFIDHNFTTGQGDISHAAGISPRFRSVYRADFAAQNPWLNANHDLPIGKCLTGAELVPNWELVRTAFYRDWLRPQRLHQCILAAIFRCAGTASFLLALRPLERMPFDAADRQCFLSLLPELRCAYELGLRFAANRSRAEVMREVLEMLPEPILIVDREGYPTFANQAAELLLSKRDGLTLACGVLAANSGQETRELRQLLQAMAGGGTEHRLVGEDMLLSRPSGAPPLIIRVAPVAYASIDGSGRTSGVALAFVRQVDPSDVARRLGGYYHMTPAEAQLATLILKGWSLAAAASELRITKNTARTHMKRIYLKTATHRQVDLIRLLASADPPPVDPLRAAAIPP